MSDHHRNIKIDNGDGNLEHLTLHISSEVLDNAFRRSLVSAGCFGAVYKIPYDGILCAAKYRCVDKTYKFEQFQQECLLHIKLHHPNILRMLGVCYHNNSDLPIKVMELLELNLSSFLFQYKVPVYVKLSLLQDVSRGLDYLHTRNPPIVHSSLSMEVILLTANLVAKIGGFTFSVEMVSETKRLPEVTADSFGNEILESSLYCGPPFDIYSFGWVLWKAIVEQPFYTIHKCLFDNPIGIILTVHGFDIDDQHSLNLITDTSLKQLVTDCMNDNPDLRPSASLISENIANMTRGEFKISLSMLHSN